MASSSETGLEPRSATDEGSSRPRRPPRRISRIFDTSPNSSFTEEVQPNRHPVQQEAPRATGSQLDRLKGQSKSIDSDLDRTPTKYNTYTAPARNVQQNEENGNGSSQSRLFRSRQSDEASIMHRLSTPNLRHQSSAATIKSSDRIDGASMSATAARVTSSREQGQSKSALYEQEIQQMRSESRLGDRDDDINDRSFSRSSIYQGTDATDTSGTEGSGPIIENRRRKKSSTSSSSKRAAARAADVRNQSDNPVKRDSPQKERLMMSRVNYSGRDPYGTLTSPLRTESAMEFNRFPPPRRTPLASAFQTSRYRSDDIVEAEHQAQRINNTIDAGRWSRGEELPPLESRDDRRRRHVSEAITSATDTSGRQSRMVIDTNGVSKHLAQSSRYGSVADNNSDWSDRSGNRSVSEIIRPRKVSASSSLSQRSSGGGSDLHRIASRASLRRNGKDVFDDGGMVPPLPNSSVHTLSPRHLAPDQLQQQTLAMAQALKQKQDRLRETRSSGSDNWRKEVEELQTRIDQLMIAAAATSPQVGVQSRSSSRLSASTSGPRSSHSNISSTPSASLARRPKDRPSTEPRMPRASTGRASSDLYSSLRHESSSRIGLRESDRRMPVTPNMLDGRGGSMSRMSGVHTGPIPSTGRFSSLGQSGNRSISASNSGGPLHERNLLNSFEIFERYMLESTRLPSDTSSLSPRSATEAVDLVNRFKETSDTAININAGLRLVLQIILDLQIDAEVGESAVDKAGKFADIDKSLSTILRDSDEQIRSLTDGLITFTRAEKERDRLRKRRSDQFNQATMPRSTSRLSSLGLSQISPGKERLLRSESRQGQREAERRSSSFDLRRSLSIRDRLTASNSNTSMQAVESRSDRSNGSRESSNSGKQNKISRRFSLLHELSPGNSTTSSQLPPSPYSPSPHPVSGVSTGVSPTLDMHSASDKHKNGRLNHNMSHARSFSELSPKVRSSKFDNETIQQRSPFLRQEKVSTNSVQTIKAPHHLSPRRSRLSFPRVSATTVNASNIMSGGAASEEGNSSEGRNGHSIADTSPDDYRDETRSIFQSLGRSRGLQVSRDM